MENTIVIGVLIFLIFYLLLNNNKNEKFNKYLLYENNKRKRCDMQNKTYNQVKNLENKHNCNNNNDLDTVLDTNNKRLNCRDYQDMNIMLNNEKRTYCDCPVSKVNSEVDSHNEYKLNRQIINNEQIE